MRSTKTEAGIRYSCILSCLLAVLPVRGQMSSFDRDKPATTFANQYSQTFNTNWDGTAFYNQWDAREADVFTATDIAAGYLQFQWIHKRVICSKAHYVIPYVLQTDIDYGTGSNGGGVVIRANPVYDIDQLQEPAGGDPGFNREGIAFYPSEDGSNMIVQFSGVYDGDATAATRIAVPKPTNVTSLMSRGTLRIEDFGASIYVYYNNAPFIRIDLKDLTKGIYASGTVYNSAMEIEGTFSDMEVEASGKVGIAQRNAALRLYSVAIQGLLKQNISFNKIGKKQISDPPFTIFASASSGLPVNYKFVSGPATISGDTVTLSGESGVVILSANQSGNSTYYPAAEELSFYVSDSAIANMTLATQDFTDNWVATDALGRTLPSYNEAGSKRKNKIIGMFYYIWQGYHDNKVYDVTKIVNGYPSDPLSASNPGWGPVGAFHFWGEPEEGYFSAEDPWVIRRNLQMLSNAHVDFIFFDVTNTFIYLSTVKKLCEISLQMRKEGIYTPQIAFITNTSSGQTMNDLYDQFYSQSLYSDLWFYWDGKPLIMGNFNDTTLRKDVKDFFTIKYSWAWTDQTKSNYWQWEDYYPQDYGWSTDPATAEQIPVSAAHDATVIVGKSYHNGKEPPVNDYYLTDSTAHGLYFAEQWKRALEVDPSVVMVSQWNEWIAERFIWKSGNGIYAGRPIKDGDSYFIDDFTEEFTRDIAPMKGGHTDNYYYQLISNIRKYKGMSAPQVFSSPTTMNMDGNFSKWKNVTPIFRDPPGDVIHRNFAGYDPTVTFVNNTGRNDIIESRSTYDANNIYFYVKTAQALTPSTDPNWMLLFIDADRNKGTGWEGYDFVVNLGVKSDTETTLKQWNGTGWGNEITVPYKVNGKELELSVPRSAVMMDQRTPEFYFKWMDNPQQLNNITCCFTDGDAAPDRRFNYNFSTSKIKVIPETPYKTLNIPGTVEFEDFNNGGAGVAYADATIGNSGGSYRTNESVDIEPMAKVGYDVTAIDSGEWLAYTINTNTSGAITTSIYYAAAGDENKAIIYIDGVDKSGLISFPSSGGLQTWARKDLNIQLTTGQHVLKFFVKNAAGDLKLDRIDFTRIKYVKTAPFDVYPNPATNRLIINSRQNKVSDIEILDTQGRPVYKNNNEFTGQKIIDISLAKGCYFLKLTGNTTFATQKLIIE